MEEELKQKQTKINELQNNVYLSKQNSLYKKEFTIKSDEESSKEDKVDQ